MIKQIEKTVVLEKRQVQGEGTVPSFYHTMKPIQKAQFFQQLATMSRGGVPLSQALNSLAVNVPSPVVNLLRRSIEAGESLEVAFALPVFSDFERTFISAGYQTGQLAASFAALGDFWQREADLSKSLRRSLTYPLVLIHIAVILPPIGLLVQNPFKYLITVGLTLGVIYLGVFLLFAWLRTVWQSPGGQGRLLFVPILGPFWRSVYRLRWVQVVGMEFNAGIGLPSAVADAWRATGAAGADRWANEANRELLAGESLSNLTSRWRLIPRDWKGYFVTGEISGQLGDTLLFLSGEAEKDYLLRRESVKEWLPKLGLIVVGLALGAQMILSYMGHIQEVIDLTKPL